KGVQENLADQQGPVMQVKHRSPPPQRRIADKMRRDAGLMAGQAAHGNRTASQMGLAEQESAQRAGILFAQMAQWSGEARQRQDAAGVHPGLVVSAQHYLADQGQGGAVHPQTTPLRHDRAGNLLTQHLHMKMTMTAGDQTRGEGAFIRQPVTQGRPGSLSLGPLCQRLPPQPRTYRYRQTLLLSHISAYQRGILTGWRGSSAGNWRAEIKSCRFHCPPRVRAGTLRF